MSLIAAADLLMLILRSAVMRTQSFYRIGRCSRHRAAVAGLMLPAPDGRASQMPLHKLFAARVLDAAMMGWRACRRAHAATMMRSIGMRWLLSSPPLSQRGASLKLTRPGR